MCKCNCFGTKRVLRTEIVLISVHGASGTYTHSYSSFYLIHQASSPRIIVPNCPRWSQFYSRLLLKPLVSVSHYMNALFTFFCLILGLHMPAFKHFLNVTAHYPVRCITFCSNKCPSSRRCLFPVSLHC